MEILRTREIDGDYWKVNALNRGLLVEFNKSPAHAFVYKKTKSMLKGLSFHEYILEPKKFSKKYITTNLDLRTPEGRQLKKNSEAEGLEILKTKDLKSFYMMENNLYNFDYILKHQTIKFVDIINNSVKEQGILADVKINDIEFAVKIKPDIVFVMGDYLIIFDIKTVKTADLGYFYHEAKKLKYNWQNSLYMPIVAHHYGLPVKFLFVLVETSAPFGVRYVELNDCLEVIEKTMMDYHTWELRGGDRSICYEPIINKMEIL